MTVQCAGCGEELLGDVNRCWKCGRPFVATHDSSQRPPVIRQPLPPLERAQASEQSAGADVGGEAGGASRELEPGEVAESGSIESEGSGQKPVARFEANRVARLAGSGDLPTPSLYPRHAAAVGGSVASVILGFFALLAGGATTMPWVGIAIGTIGILMGTWGLVGSRRRIAMVGITVCCVAMAISGGRGLVQAYTAVHGTGPFVPDIEESLSPEEREQLNY